MNQVVVLVLVIGVVCASALALVTPLLESPVGVPTGRPTGIHLALLVALAAAGELVSVRVRRGDTSEDLTFLEVVLAAAALIVAPLWALAAVLTGLLLASLAQRRDLPKTLFNIGSYCTSTAAMLLLYHSLALGSDRFSTRSILALLISTFCFAIVNVALLSLVLHAVGGEAPADFLSAEWRISATMAVGGVGAGATAVFLANAGAWALLPFVAMPVLAMWYAYLAAAQHVEARLRNGWLIQLGQSLAQHGRDSAALAESSEAVRRVFAAPEILVLANQTTAEAHRTTSLDISAATADPRALSAAELPEGWTTGVVTSLDLGAEEPGALLLGSTVPYRRSRIVGRTRGWSLAEADAPVLGALVAAVGSAMRAGAAFNALTEETAKLSAVVDNTSDGIAMVDDTDTIRLWSRTLERMTGVSSNTLLGHSGRSLPPVVRTLLEASTTAETAGERRTVHVHLVRADGEELDVSLATVWVRASITGRADEEPGWVSILTVHDETRERRVERMKSEFVATVSHELRTPLTPIKGYAPWLASHGDRIPLAKRTEALRVIADSADHLSRLVDDLLIASQVSEGSRLGVTMGVLDLDEVVSQAVSRFPALSGRINLDLPAGTVKIQCDGVRAIQCLSNLLQNAAKYTPEDSPLEVRAEVSGMHARIHVRDHGLGIPVEEHERIFERFYRREDPFTMRTGGAGLGLNIARELAVAMGGGLVVQTPDSGTGAEFVLHLATADAPRVNGGQRSEAAADSKPGYRPDPRLGATPPGLSADSTGDATMGDPRAQRLATK